MRVDDVVWCHAGAGEIDFRIGRTHGDKTRIQNHAIGRAVVVAASTITDEQADRVDQAVAVAVTEDGTGARYGIPGESPDGLGVGIDLEVGVVLAFTQAQINAVNLSHGLVDHLCGQQIDLTFIHQTGSHNLWVHPEFEYIADVRHGLRAAQRRAQDFATADGTVLDAVDLHLHLEIAPCVEAGVVKQVAEYRRLHRGVNGDILTCAHLQRGHIALIRVVDAVVVQVEKAFFFCKDDAIAVQFLLVGLALWRHDPHRCGRTGLRDVARPVLELVLHGPVAFWQGGQGHDGVGGCVVEAWDDPTIHHQCHTGHARRHGLDTQADHAAGRRVRPDQHRRLQGGCRRRGDQLVALHKALALQGAAVAHHLQLDGFASAGFQLGVGPVQRGALHHGRQVCPAGAGDACVGAVQAAVEPVVGPQCGTQAGGDGLQRLACDEVMGPQPGVAGQLQAGQGRQLVEHAVDQGLQVSREAHATARIGRCGDVGFERGQFVAAQARSVQAQGLQVGQTQGLGVARSSRHDTGDGQGQGFDFGHRVHFLGDQTGDGTVEQLQTCGAQAGGGAGANRAVGIGEWVHAGCRIRQGAIGFGQDQVPGVDDGLRFGTGVGQRPGDR